MRSPFGHTRTRITREERRATVDIVRKRSVGTLPVITTSADVPASPRSGVEGGIGDVGVRRRLLPG